MSQVRKKEQLEDSPESERRIKKKIHLVKDEESFTDYIVEILYHARIRTYEQTIYKKRTYF